MIRAQRVAHRRVWVVLLPMLLALFLAAVIRGYDAPPQDPPAVLERAR
ncbi:MAG: hypothetical protein AAGH15_15200 [Myxococcota bacterium]